MGGCAKKSICTARPSPNSPSWGYGRAAAPTVRAGNTRLGRNPIINTLQRSAGGAQASDSAEYWRERRGNKRAKNSLTKVTLFLAHTAELQRWLSLPRPSSSQGTPGTPCSRRQPRTAMGRGAGACVRPRGFAAGAGGCRHGLEQPETSVSKCSMPTCPSPWRLTPRWAHTTPLGLLQILTP